MDLKDPVDEADEVKNCVGALAECKNCAGVAAVCSVIYDAAENEETQEGIDTLVQDAKAAPKAEDIELGDVLVQRLQSIKPKVKAKESWDPF